jgi:hypothetical protein
LSGSGEVSNFLLGHGLRWERCGRGLGTGRVGLAERWLEGPQDEAREALEVPRTVLVVRLYLSTWFSDGNVIVAQQVYLSSSLLSVGYYLKKRT